jgi:hypothetical protein
MHLSYCIIIVLCVYLIFSWGLPCIEGFAASNDALLDEIAQELVKIDPRLDKISLFGADKTYTINKQKVYICTKDGNGNPYRDKESLYHVASHEFSHVLCKSIGHTPEFYEIFNDLKRKMAARGLIRDPNRDILPNYCGYN